MVLTIKREPSNDLNYSSLMQDQKAWASKGFYVSRTTRQSATFPTLQNLSIPRRGEKAQEQFYGGKPSLQRDVEKSPVRYSILSSKQTKTMDAATYKAKDTRFRKSQFPYSKSLGPGSYRGAEAPPQEKKERGSKLGMSSFLSTPRPQDQVPNLPDTSDTLARDKQQWLASGFFTSRAKRTKGEPEFWRSGGLWAMSRKLRVPAFDAMYDTDTGNVRTMAHSIRDSPQRYRAAFSSARPQRTPMPNLRTNDSRLRSGRTECSPDIGPGTYSYAQADGEHSYSAPPTPSSPKLAIYDATFRGPPHFFPGKGSQSLMRDSRLLRTW